jgi:hypothetical protein
VAGARVEPKEKSASSLFVIIGFSSRVIPTVPRLPGEAAFAVTAGGVRSLPRA